MVIPLVAIVLLVVIQAVVVFRERLSLVGRCAAAGREAVVHSGSAEAEGPSLEAARRYAGPVHGVLSVDIAGGSSPGGLFTVTCRQVVPTDVPLVGPLVGEVTWTERLVGRRETSYLEGP